MANNNEILNARLMARKYTYETIVKGLKELTLEGTLDLRDGEYDDRVYLTNKSGEVDLSSLLWLASREDADISISFKFKTPINVSDSE